MKDERHLIFYMDAYSPESIPMARLAEYMADFAALLGKENAVHFAGLQKGSTKIVARVESEDLPKVTMRLHDLRRGNSAKDAVKIFDQIDERLASDNAIGRIYIKEKEFEPAEVLVFPGRTRPKLQSYGPFNQEGHLDGLLISVGGKDDSISLRLQNGEAIYTNCDTTRVIARELGKHLFEPIRIYGTGRWMREANGKWILLRFRVRRFEPLSTDSLREAVNALRAVRGSGWANIENTGAELKNLRRDDEDEMH